MMVMMMMATMVTTPARILRQRSCCTGWSAPCVSLPSIGPSRCYPTMTMGLHRSGTSRCQVMIFIVIWRLRLPAAGLAFTYIGQKVRDEFGALV
jgi:hypothetical protein